MSNFWLYAIITVVFLLVMFSAFPFTRNLAKGFLNAVTGGIPWLDEGGLEKQENLYSQINLLIKDRASEIKTAKLEDFRFEEDTLLVGFDKEWSTTEKQTGKDPISKPKACEGKACICIFEDATFGNDFKNIKSCTTFEHDIIFLGIDDSALQTKVNYGGARTAELKGATKYEYLIIYEDFCATCDPFGTRPIYIEKQTKGTKHYIFIAPANIKAVADREKQVKAA